MDEGEAVVGESLPLSELFFFGYDVSSAAAMDIIRFSSGNIHRNGLNSKYQSICSSIRTFFT